MGAFLFDKSYNKAYMEELRQEIESLKKRIELLEKPASFSDEFMTLLQRVGFLKEIKTFDFRTAADIDWITIFVQANDRIKAITARPDAYFKEFTVNISTNEIVSPLHGLSDGAQVLVRSTGSLPSPLSAVIPYWVTSSNKDTFKLASAYPASPGDIIDITNGGIGTQFWEYFT